MRVDFYHLTTRPLDRVLPQIAGRVLADGDRLLIVSADEAQRVALDRLLWTFAADSFLPHGLAGAGDEAAQLVLIAGDAAAAANGARHVALVDGHWRDEALGFDRAFHFFDEEHIQPARLAWKALGARDGIERNYWQQKEEGGWRRQADRLIPPRLPSRVPPPRARADPKPSSDRSCVTDMAANRTFSIIKPDATRRNLTGAVTKMLEEAGLRVVASKRLLLSTAQAEGFYAVHAERPFYRDLVDFMTSGPVVVQVLEGEDAVQRNRDIMGATNPANADAGTIRKELAESIEANTVHGSDSDENAATEIAFFFRPEEIVG